MSTEEKDTKSTAEPTSTQPKIFMPLVWIDCEMTGLDHKNDVIIEVCAIITDGHLNIIDEVGYESVIHCTKEKFDQMGEWCTNQHTQSGLVDKCLNATDRTMSLVEDELLAYIQKYIPNPNRALLAGSSVHMDKIFLMKDMPKIIEHLHYRLLDVSAFMEICRRVNYPLFKCMELPVSDHTAKSDILKSINLMKWYRDHFLKLPAETKDFVDAYNIEKKEREEKEKAEEKQEVEVEKRKLEDDDDESIAKKQKTE